MHSLKSFLTQKNFFYKMHGTGNDFILINGIQTHENKLSRQESVLLAQKLCHRKFGIGADGLLIVRKINDKYKMQVINSDGSEPNMCGNGLRCFVALLYHEKMISQSCTVLTDDGQKQINIQELSKPESFKNKKYLVTLKIGKGGLIQQFNHQRYNKIFLTTIGVPHLVIFLSKQQFSLINFELQGKQIQKKFDANINFCKIVDNQSITIKTYQRGAGLTYSCGTGVSSSVYVAVAKQKLINKAVKANTDGGQIYIQITEELDVIMKGPAQIICEGKFFS